MLAATNAMLLFTESKTGIIINSTYQADMD